MYRVDACGCRVPVPANDPIVAITCILHSSKEATAAAAIGPATDLTVGDGELDDELGIGDGDGSGDADGDGATAAAPAPASQRVSGDKVVFTWGPGRDRRVLHERTSGADVRCYENEEAMLLAWQEHFRTADPDAIPVFQVS